MPLGLLKDTVMTVGWKHELLAGLVRNLLIREVTPLACTFGPLAALCLECRCNAGEEAVIL